MRYRTIQVGLAAGVNYRVSDRFSASLDIGYNRQLRNYDLELDSNAPPSRALTYRFVANNSSWGQLQSRLTVRYHFGKNHRNRPR